MESTQQTVELKQREILDAHKKVSDLESAYYAMVQTKNEALKEVCVCVYYCVCACVCVCVCVYVCVCVCICLCL